MLEPFESHGRTLSTPEKNALVIEFFSEEIKRSRKLAHITNYSQLQRWFELARQWFDLEFQIDPVLCKMPREERTRMVKMIMRKLRSATQQIH